MCNVIQKWSEVSKREEMDVGSEMGRNVAFEDWNEMKWNGSHVTTEVTCQRVKKRWERMELWNGIKSK